MGDSNVGAPPVRTTNSSAAKLVAVIKREFLERVRTRAFLITTLLGPVLFAAISIFPAWLALREKGSDAVARVAIVDATGTSLGDRIARALTDSLPGAAGAAAQQPTLVRVDPAGLATAERAATAAVVRKEREGVLVLDSATLADSRARYVGRNASSLADMQRLRDVVRREVLTARLEHAGFAADRVAPIARARLQLTTTTVSDSGKGGSGIGGTIAAFIVAMLLYITIILYGQNVLRSVVEEKTTRVAEVIIASVKPDILMTGKVLGVGAVGLVQQVIWFGGALAVGAYVTPFLHLDRPTGPAGAARQAAEAADATAAFAMPEITFGVVATAVLFFLLGYLLYSALFAAAGAMVNSDQEAQQASLPVMLPLIGSAVFMQVVLQNPESGMARAMAWFPLTAPVLMPMRMSLVGTTPLEVGLVVLGLLLTALGALWVSARIYRVGMLMYGKRPSLVELARWVAQAG